MNNPTSTWIPVKNKLPEEFKKVLTRRKTRYGFTEPIELRRKGELWFFPDWTQKTYNEPDFWCECSD